MKLALVLLCFAATSLPLSAAEFIDIGTTFVNSVSADGTTVVGRQRSTDGQGDGFRWTADQGMQTLESLPGEDNRDPTALNASGSEAVGVSYDFDEANSISPVAWGPTGAVRSLDLPRGTIPYALSADGSSIVGGMPNDSDGGDIAFRQGNGEQAIELGRLPGFDESRATAVSADGKVIVGEVFSGEVNVADRRAEPF